MNIDWDQLVTKAMREATAAAETLTKAKADIAHHDATAAAQILGIQDRIDTLGYGLDSGKATSEDEAERAELIGVLKAWKAYKFELGNVSKQASWPESFLLPEQPTLPA